MHKGNFEVEQFAAYHIQYVAGKMVTASWEGDAYMAGLSITQLQAVFGSEPGWVCAGCYRMAPEMQCCAGCKYTHYCNRTCQRQHWRECHKHECTALTDV